MKSRQPPETVIYAQKRVSAFLQFIVLFAFWLFLSGRYQAKYIIIGAISAALVTFLTNDLFYAALVHGERARVTPGLAFRQVWRFIIYLPWLISRIFLANIQVAGIVLNPGLPIDPGFLIFRVTMKKGMAQVTLANSITLTPGTIAISLDDSRYLLHALKRSLASELESGTTQNKIAAIYLEAREKPPITHWVHRIEDIEK